MEIHRDITVAIQSQYKYAGLVAHLTHYFGAVQMQEFHNHRGKVITHGVGATAKLEATFKTVMQKANIGRQEVLTLRCAAQVRAVYVVQQVLPADASALRAVNQVGLCASTVTETTSTAGVAQNTANVDLKHLKHVHGGVVQWSVTSVQIKVTNITLAV